MENNIIKSLVKSDKEIQKKLQILEKEHEAFLEKLFEFKQAEEKRLDNKLKLEVQQIKKEYESTLKKLERQLMEQGNQQSIEKEIKNLEKEAEKLFQQMLLLK